MFEFLNTGTGGSGVASVVAGTNITVNNTDPANPIISSTGGGLSPTTITTSTTAVNNTAYYCDCTSGNITLTVGSGITNISVKKIDSTANTVIINTGSATIDGYASPYTILFQNTNIPLQKVGSNFFIQ